MPLRELSETLQTELSDAEFARVYLQEALEDSDRTGDVEGFLLALSDVIRAQRAVSAVADRVGVSRPGLYKALGAGGRPQFATVAKILPALGFRLTIRAARGGRRPSAGRSCRGDAAPVQDR